MSKKYFLLTLGLVVVLSLITGCAKAPQQAIDAAKTALESAKIAEADRYLPDQYNAAKDTLDAALVEIETQNSKFALKRNYDHAQQLLTSVVNLAGKAAAEVAIKKEEVKNEVAQMVTNLTTGIEETKVLLKKAPRGKEGREVLDQMSVELTTLENSINEVNSLNEAGNYIDAKDKAAAIATKVNSIKEELQNAIAKKSGKAK